MNDLFGQFPPPPSSGDRLCDAARYVADKVEEIIQKVLNDMQTLTLRELIESVSEYGLLITGLWEFIQWVITNVNDAQAMISDVHAALDALVCQMYCNRDLSREVVKGYLFELTPSVIHIIVRDCILHVIDSVSDTLWASWIFVGSVVPSGVPCDNCDCGDQECQPIAPSKQSYAYGVDPFCVLLGQPEEDYVKAVASEHGNVSVAVIFTSDVTFTSVTMKTRYTGDSAYVRYGFRVYDSNDNIVYTHTFWSAITAAYSWWTDSLPNMNVTGRKIVFYAQDMTLNGAWQYFSMKDMQFTIGV